MTEIVLYGFTDRKGAENLSTLPTTLKQDYSLPGIDIIEVGNVAAIIGPQPKWRYFRTVDHNNLTRLQQYQSVLEAALREAPILPARHQTVLPNRGAISNLLAQHGPSIIQPLRQYGSLLEFEIEIRWDMSEIVRNILGKDGLEAPDSPDDTHAMTEALDIAIERKREALAKFINQAITAVTLDEIRVDVRDRDILCNLIVLVRRDNCDALMKLLGQINSSGIGKLDMNCIGPLPPCSFASVEVWLSDAQMVEDARNSLRLGAIVSKDDIRKAYHQAMKSLHPDVNKGRAAAERITAIQHSYELLSLIADGLNNSPPTLNDGQPDRTQQVLLDEASLERTYLISLRREGEGLDYAA